MCNKNRINCRELHKYQKVIGCGSDEFPSICNKTASEACGELCSLVKIACEEDKNEIITPCAELQGGEGSGSGRFRVFLAPTRAQEFFLGQRYIEHSASI